ncbi:hypothetical protein [Komagataeibacter rhaeticus]|uniref:hypothetical protein n=1 Tax=Komagataeibacter rhaeticus TaxID=215221 RepID=UPI0039EA2C04
MTTRSAEPPTASTSLIPEMGPLLWQWHAGRGWHRATGFGSRPLSWSGLPHPASGHPRGTQVAATVPLKQRSAMAAFTPYPPTADTRYAHAAFINKAKGYQATGGVTEILDTQGRRFQIAALRHNPHCHPTRRAA